MRAAEPAGKDLSRAGDPVLLSCQIRPRQYYIGSNFSPFSIRDQMLRGCAVVLRAIENRLIDQQNNLLVIGAGPAGVSAAVTAASAGVSVDIVDRSESSFNAQARCRTRIIDAHAYDWPVPVWTERSVRDLPLSLEARAPAALVNDWRESWARYRESFKDNLFVSYRTLVDFGKLTYEKHEPDPRDPIRYDRDEDNLTVEFTAVGDPDHELDNRINMLRKRTYAMVLIAVGFSQERVWVRPEEGNFCGLPFWESDKAHLPRLGKTGTGPVSVLISGSGDGAQQDFLRVVTGQMSVRTILDAVLVAAGKQSQSITARLALAEAEAERCWLWARSSVHQHRIFDNLDRIYGEVINSIWKPALRRTLAEMTREKMRDTSVVWVHSCTHFSRAYPLNRFLSLLLLRYLSESKAAVRRTNEVVSDVRHPHGSCSEDCFWRRHIVNTAAETCAHKWNPSNPGTRLDEFDVVILRHGVDPPLRPPVLFPRQLLPYRATGFLF